MSRRKGVSIEEKRTRLLQLFYEKKEFFTLKELEKIAPVEKGIVAQSVKDVLQSLVDDGLVCTDKIGTSIYFWAFPGANITSLEYKISEGTKNLVEAEFKLKKLTEECAKAEAGREDSEERRNILQEIEQLKAKERDLQNKISEFSDYDPEAIEKMKEEAEAYKTAANVWTDNIFAIQSWCKNKFDISTETLNKHFNIPEDLDYVG